MRHDGCSHQWTVFGCAEPAQHGDEERDGGGLGGGWKDTDGEDGNDRQGDGSGGEDEASPADPVGRVTTTV
ncbi:MAG: hypothetical protein ACRDMV_14375 [Streptosporangiales bacterium]